MEAELMDRRKSGWDLRSCTNKLSCFFLSYLVLGCCVLLPWLDKVSSVDYEHNDFNRKEVSICQMPYLSQLKMLSSFYNRQKFSPFPLNKLGIILTLRAATTSLTYDRRWHMASKSPLSFSPTRCCLLYKKKVYLYKHHILNHSDTDRNHIISFPKTIDKIYKTKILLHLPLYNPLYCSSEKSYMASSCTCTCQGWHNREEMRHARQTLTSSWHQRGTQRNQRSEKGMCYLLKRKAKGTHY